MDESLVLTDMSHKHCAVLTLNRPTKRNALTIQLMDEFIEAIENIQKTDKRAIIIRGAGAAFCTGLDLKEASDSSLEERSSRVVSHLLRAVDECVLPTIAVVHGAALAGGAGLVCACDLAVAETETSFGFPETRRGLVAAIVMPYLLRLIALRDAKELLLLGDTINTQKAYEIGLINHVSITYSGMSDALKFVDCIVKGAPQATTLTKKLITRLDTIDLEEGLEMHRQVRRGQEFKEGTQAFLEKRLPSWS